MFIFSEVIMFKRIIVVFLLVALISGSFAAYGFAQSPVRKLGRGLGNLLFGFLEVPINIVDAAEEDGYIAAVTYGVGKGVGMFALRTGVGIYEVVTFLIPLPFHYEPILEPEFLMSDESF